MSVKEGEHELGNMATAQAQQVVYDADKPGSPQVEEVKGKESYEDEQALARLGKKAVLKRNFGFMAILGFSCTVLITWEAVVLLATGGLTNGGTAGLIYGYIIIWLGNISVFTCLSELASMAPTSGGQYHWVAMLAPRRFAKFLSYIAGWLTIGGWQGSITSASVLTAQMCQGIYIMSKGTPENPISPPQWLVSVIVIAVVLWCTFINTIVSATLPKFEGAILILHIVGFFAILIPLCVLGVKADAHDVFTIFSNGGGWSTNGLAFFVGLMGNVFAFVGVDAAFHMSEETKNAAVVVPRSIFLSVMINGTTGFIMIIIFLLCITDIDAIAADPSGFAHMGVFKQVVGPNGLSGAVFMAALILIMAFCADVGLMASSSRVFWSFARDRGVPFWRVLSKVDSRTSVPLYAVLVTSVITILLGLINIGSNTALNAVLSLSISCLYGSYLLCAGLLLYRRCTSGFSMPSSAEMPALANTSGAQLVWGPWHIKGALGIANNIFACIYLIIIAIFSFFPTSAAVTTTNMNWASAVTGGMMIFALIYYAVWARKEYNGPIVEVDI